MTAGEPPRAGRGAGAGPPGGDEAPGAGLTRAEEELRVTTEWRPSRTLRLRRVVDRVPVDQRVPLQAEVAEIERVPVDDPAADSGEVERLDDGSLSIPLMSEEVEVVRRTVVRERAVVRVAPAPAGDARVSGSLLRERLEIVEDPSAEDGSAT